MDGNTIGVTYASPVDRLFKKSQDSFNNKTTVFSDKNSILNNFKKLNEFSESSLYSLKSGDVVRFR